MVDTYADSVDKIQELCSALTKENKKYVLAVAQALYFTQNDGSDGSDISSQKSGYFYTESVRNDQFRENISLKF